MNSRPKNSTRGLCKDRPRRASKPQPVGFKASDGICRIKSPELPFELWVPIPWVERFAEWPLQRARQAAERVQMRLETHGEWLEIWNAINAALSDIAELRREAYAYWNSGEHREPAASERLPLPGPPLSRSGAKRRSPSLSKSHNSTERPFVLQTGEPSSYKSKHGL